MSNEYSNVPDWVKNLKIGEDLVIYFPRQSNIVYAHVTDNIVPKDPDYLAILTINYKVDSVEKNEELLYDNYSNEDASQSCWYAYQIM